MIDKNRIFQLFDDKGNEIRIANAKDINDFLSGPYAKIGMFTKLIQNHNVFHLRNNYHLYLGYNILLYLLNH